MITNTLEQSRVKSYKFMLKSGKKLEKSVNQSKLPSNEQLKYMHATPPKCELKKSLKKKNSEQISPSRYKFTNEILSMMGNYRRNFKLNLIPLEKVRSSISSSQLASSRLSTSQQKLDMNKSNPSLNESKSALLHPRILKIPEKVKNSSIVDRLRLTFLKNEEFLRKNQEMISNSIPLLPNIKRRRAANKPSKVLKRKVLSSIKHYKQLKLDLSPPEKIFEYFPGVPYGLENSKEFIGACKEGNIKTVSKFLIENRWLAHVFDRSGQSAIHWAAVRGHLNLVKLLLKYGVYIDTSDYAGRTPLFIAAKNSYYSIFAYLLSQNANPFIKTRAGTKILQITKEVTIKKLLENYRKKLYFKLLNEWRNEINN